MANLYSNENFPLPAVEELRTLGHDVLTTVDAGKANRSIPDEDVLAYATSQRRILLTLNRKHFVQLHNATPDHPGIIVCTYDADFRALAQRIHEVLVSGTDMCNQLVRVNRPNH
jgi:predicted nuclease of predicted toxin-antitoxin system